MIVVGLTGDFGSGKSSVSAILRRRGAAVFDADLAARRLVRKGTSLYRAIVTLFGREFVGRDGQIDRAKLARRVFASPADLRKLNVLTHPAVILEAMRLIERSRRKKGLFVLDVPLLFEAHMESLADVTVVVTAPRNEILRRSERRGIPAGLVRRILASQWPAARKIRLADHVIRNDGTRKALERKVLEVREKILKKTR